MTDEQLGKAIEKARRVLERKEAALHKFRDAIADGDALLAGTPATKPREEIEMVLEFPDVNSDSHECPDFSNARWNYARGGHLPEKEKANDGT